MVCSQRELKQQLWSDKIVLKDYEAFIEEYQK